jgi:cytochrome c-type biogenesis protein CcmH
VIRPALLLAALALAVPAFAQETPPPAVPEGEFEAPQEDPRTVVGAPRGSTLAGAALETRTEEVAGLLRCPVCQGLSVADSPASMAVKMKARVRELIAEGYDEEQVLAYFERSYGEFVRLEPPKRGINWLVWLAPPLALALGLAFVARVMRRRPAAAPSASSTVPADPELAAYVLRVRELAYGWPGGVPPEPKP